MWNALVLVTVVIMVLAGVAVVIAGLTRDEVWTIAAGMFIILCGISMVRYRDR